MNVSHKVKQTSNFLDYFVQGSNVYPSVNVLQQHHLKYPFVTGMNLRRTRPLIHVCWLNEIYQLLPLFLNNIKFKPLMVAILRIVSILPGKKNFTIEYCNYYSIITNCYHCFLNNVKQTMVAYLWYKTAITSQLVTIATIEYFYFGSNYHPI